MDDYLEFLSPTDKPALVAISNPEAKQQAKAALEGLGYKVHSVENHAGFQNTFPQAQYQVVVIDALFSSTQPQENSTLQSVQSMPMPQRRHAAFVLLGASFNTLDPMQAFQQSVHAVVNPTDLARLGQVIGKVITDNDLFLSIYRDVLDQMSRGKS